VRSPARDPTFRTAFLIYSILLASSNP
jgi:hypothetical protein